MNPDDMDALLRRLDPARLESIPEPDSLLARRIRNDALESGRARWGQRGGLVAAIAAALIISAGSAAAFLLTTGSSPEPVQTLCFDAPNLEANMVGMTVGTRPDVADCYRLWQDGTFASDGVVPPLAACLLDSAGTAVLPGDETVCARLGLGVAQAASEPDPVVELQAKLDALVPLGACAPFDETVGSMRNVLASLDLPGWELQVRTEPTAERPCASFSIEGDAKTVVVVPIPGV